MKPHEVVTPAEAGVQKLLASLDSGFRRNDGKTLLSEFLRLYQFVNRKTRRQSWKS